MENKSIKISFVINLIIAIFTVIASIIMFTGFKFMHGPETALECTKIEMLKFFTVESNIFMGIVASIFAIKQRRILKGQDDKITKKDYLLNLMATTSVGLTFFIVVAYFSMFMNSNLFFHFIIPVLSIINLVVFERTNLMSFKYSFCGIIPAAIYSLFYMINVFMHTENGMVSTEYDWYWFVQNGVWTSAIVVPTILGVTYFISFIFWRINRKK